MGKTVQITMAKASKDDINSTRMLLQCLETMSESDFDLKNWENDEEEKEFYETLKSFCDEEGQPDIDNLLFAFNMSFSHKWRRVVEGCDILIDNMCDPNINHLAYKSEIANLMPEEEKE